MPTKILERIYLGNLIDAELSYGREGWITINVLEKDIENTLEDYYVPILYKDGKQKYHLDWNKVIEAADLLEKVYQEKPKKKVLLHCGAGHERSPLVMQYYLVRHHGMGADEAFAFLEKLRPSIRRCDKDYLW